MTGVHSRSTTKVFEKDPLLRFTYAYDRLGAAMTIGHTRPRLWKAKRFRLRDPHGSHIDCNEFIELRHHFNSPTFPTSEIAGYFMILEDTLGFPFGRVKFRMTKVSAQDSDEWELTVSIDGTNQGQVLGGLAQAESILSHVASMEAAQLEEDTAPLFEAPQKGPVRRFFARIAEGVLSNLLSSTIVGALGIALGWFVGRSTG